MSNKTSAINEFLTKVWSLISLRRKYQVIFLLLLMLLSAGCELLSLAAIVPFLAALENPELLWKYAFIRKILITLGIESASKSLLFITLLFIFTVVLAALIRLLNLRISGILAAKIGSDLSIDAYKRTLYQPYEVHITRNTSTIINSMVSQVGRAVNGLNNILLMMTSIIVSIALISGLIFINFTLTFYIFLSFSIAYCFLVLSSKRELKRNSEAIETVSIRLLKSLQEGLGSIRDVLMGNTQDEYVRLYEESDKPQRLLLAKNQFIASYPRYALEALGILIISVAGFVVVNNKGDGTQVIPLLGTFALGSQRLLPSIQGVYASWAKVKSYEADLRTVSYLISQPVNEFSPLRQENKLKNKVEFNDISYVYPNSNKPSILSATFTINKGDCIGIIGETGSGKSTLVDLIMGLLIPSSGTIFIDQKDLYGPNNQSNLLSWRASIAHVPQSIYMSDKSIAENIAFGVPSHLINHSRVVFAAKKAHAFNFIMNLPSGFDSQVGERGISLSGGQRQRIGIARALYRDCHLLVLDEATSSLDSNTEKIIIKNIEEYNNQLTIIMIAHRLSTLECCNKRIKLENGVVRVI